jgi:hypothetical protein
VFQPFEASAGAAGENAVGGQDHGLLRYCYRRGAGGALLHPIVEHFLIESAMSARRNGVANHSMRLAGLIVSAWRTWVSSQAGAAVSRNVA